MSPMAQRSCAVCSLIYSYLLNVSMTLMYQFCGAYLTVDRFLTCCTKYVDIRHRLNVSFFLVDFLVAKKNTVWITLNFITQTNLTHLI